MTAAAAIPFVHPDRPRGGFRPLKALHHFRKLIADKEDTEQVFHILESLRDDRFLTSARRFGESDVGARVIAEHEYLPDILDDHAALRRLPAGSVAHAYCDFMESEGLSAAGLVAEQQKFQHGRPHFDDQLERYGERLRDTHDLFHVLTGYGRDALGEQCVLAFSYSQSPSWGTLFIAWAGAREIRKHVPGDVPIYGAVREGQRNGKAAQQIAQQDIRALLAEPVDAARARLGIPEPLVYRDAHARLIAHGIDPYSTLTDVKQAVAAEPELAQAA